MALLLLFGGGKAQHRHVGRLEAPQTHQTACFLKAKPKIQYAAVDSVWARLGTSQGLLILQQTQTHYCICTKWKFVADQGFRSWPKATDRSCNHIGSRCAPLIHTAVLPGGNTFTAVAGGTEQPPGPVLPGVDSVLGVLRV